MRFINLIFFVLRAKSDGYENYRDAYLFYSSELNKLDSWEEEAGVCAVVRIRINQQVALTREGFLATLELENHESNMLTEINVNISILDSMTGEESVHLFSFGNPKPNGDMNEWGQKVNNQFSLEAGKSGSVSWFFVPYSEAAPVEER